MGSGDAAARVPHRPARRRSRDGDDPRRGAVRLARRAHRPPRPPRLGDGGGAAARDPELRRRPLPAQPLRGEGAAAAGPRRRAPSRSDRVLGRSRRTDAVHVPVRVPAHAGGTSRPRPGPGGSRAEPRRLPAARALQGDAAVGAAGDLARLAARRALHALRLRRRLADAVRRPHARHLPAVPQPLRPHAGGGARARPRRPHGARADARGAGPLSRAALPDEPGSGAAREARAARPLARAGTRLVRPRRDGVPRAARLRARVLAPAGDRQRPGARAPLERGALLARRLGPRRRRRGRRRRCPSRSSRCATRRGARACSSGSPSPGTRSPAS